MVTAIGRDSSKHQWHVLAIDQQSLFRPWFAAIDGAGAGGFATAEGTRMSRIDDGDLQMQLLLVIQHGQKQVMQLISNSGSLSRLQPRASSFATAAHLLWHTFPATPRACESIDARQFFHRLPVTSTNQITLSTSR